MTDNLLASICCIAQQAGQTILSFYQQNVGHKRKHDNSPVTEADLAANHIIVESLARLNPEIPIISEEQPSHYLPVGTTRFWLVDPLDGTKSFIRGEEGFTVNIALIEKGMPRLGVIFIPVLKQLYFGEVGKGAWRQIDEKAHEAIHTRVVPEAGLCVMVSHRHRTPRVDRFLRDYVVRTRVAASSSLKFCRVAEGVADLYPRFGPTMEWDTAAGHAIVLAAGGRVTAPDGSPFLYGAPDFRNGPFVAWGK